MSTWKSVHLPTSGKVCTCVQIGKRVHMCPPLEKYAYVSTSGIECTNAHIWKKCAYAHLWKSVHICLPLEKSAHVPTSGKVCTCVYCTSGKECPCAHIWKSVHICPCMGKCVYVDLWKSVHISDSGKVVICPPLEKWSFAHL